MPSARWCSNECDVGIDGSPLADANGDGRKFHHRFLMPVFRPPFMALNVTYMGLVPMEKSCAIFSPVLLAILKSWRIVCVLPKVPTSHKAKET